MKVILLADIKNLGRKGQVITVADGLAHNSLLPQKKAVIATAENLKQHQALQNDKANHAQHEQDLVVKFFANLGESVTMSAKATEQGTLFKSIRPDEILAHMARQTGQSVPTGLVKTDTTVIKALGVNDISFFYAKNFAIKKNVLVTVIAT